MYLIIDRMDQKKTYLPHFQKMPNDIGDEFLVQIHLVVCLLYFHEIKPQIYLFTMTLILQSQSCNEYYNLGQVYCQLFYMCNLTTHGFWLFEYASKKGYIQEDQGKCLSRWTYTRSYSSNVQQILKEISMMRCLHTSHANQVDQSSLHTKTRSTSSD